MKSGLKIIGLEFLYLLICAAAAAAGVRVRSGYIIPFGNVNHAVDFDSAKLSPIDDIISLSEDPIGFKSYILK